MSDGWDGLVGIIEGFTELMRFSWAIKRFVANCRELERSFDWENNGKIEDVRENWGD
jgi:hypothetical protein